MAAVHTCSGIPVRLEGGVGGGKLKESLHCHLQNATQELETIAITLWDW